MTYRIRERDVEVGIQTRKDRLKLRAEELVKLRERRRIFLEKIDAEITEAERQCIEAQCELAWVEGYKGGRNKEFFYPV